MTDGVELRAVTKTYGAVRALVSATARFDFGRVGVVRGENGSGKSTLLAVVGTLARPTSGTITYGSLGTTRRDVRRSAGWLGHESLCYPELTGRESIELAARLTGIDPKGAFLEASERFGLAAFAERPLRTYSRGQRQRVALARATVHRPMLLLLDEPTTGLDERSVATMTTAVRDEAARGAVVVVVTHDDGFARAVADDEVRLERGRVVERRTVR
jgi:ABC-type multidrug transport system ATPase subunit